MINRKATALPLIAISILFSSAVFADDSGSVNDQMTVKLTVEKSYKVSVDGMDFGSHGSNNGVVTASAKAYVTCTNGIGYMPRTDKTHDFEMSSNDTADAKKVAYTLSTDHPGGTSLVDNGISAIGTGEQQALLIFGKVTANTPKQVSVGDYTDTVTLTVTYRSNIKGTAYEVIYFMGWCQCLEPGLHNKFIRCRPAGVPGHSGIL